MYSSKVLSSLCYCYSKGKEGKSERNDEKREIRVGDERIKWGKKPLLETSLCKLKFPRNHFNVMKTCLVIAK